MFRIVPWRLLLALAPLVSTACGDAECPDGFTKRGSLCRRSLDGSVDPAMPSDASSDDGASVAPDAPDPNGTTLDPSGPSSQGDAGDAQAATSSARVDASTEADASPTSECDATRVCLSGSVCTNGRCVSLCAQTQCDSNASCSVSGGAALCTCNGGFASSGSGTSVRCTKSVACEQLGCDTNAACDTTGSTPRCVCKPGFTGSGSTCAPVSCPLTVENGSGSPGTYLQNASYTCNRGYTKATGSARCEANGMWSGSAPACLPVDCKAPPAVKFARSSTAEGTTFMKQVTYTCENGLRLSPVGGTSICQASGQWSEPPSCVGCGDGVVSSALDETCEPGNPGWSSWTCDPVTCKRTTLYAPCDDPRTSSQQCAAGQICLFGRCSLGCTSDSSCPKTPKGSVPRAVCEGQLYCVTTGCTKSADCAPGLICNAGSCVACDLNSTSSQCPLFQSCQDRLQDGTFAGVCF